MRFVGTFSLSVLLAVGFRPANAQLYVIGIDGSGNAKQVDHINFDLNSISLNKAGDEFLLSGQSNNIERVFSMASNGKNLKQLTPHGAPPSASPVFAPDQANIVFGEYDTSGSEIVMTDKTWTSRKVLNGKGGGPSFSSDGAQMVFERYTGGPTYSTLLFVSKADGSGEQEITPLNSIALGPKFNPQKNKTIVFAEVGVGIVSINSDGTGRQILLNDGYASEPVYTPDGKQIVYAGSRPAILNMIYTS